VVTHPDQALNTLARLLERAGLNARVTQPIGRPPGLHVQNPELPALEEHVVLDRCDQGRWWLFWAWAERIAPADDLDGAVECIRRVVGASDEIAYSTPMSRG
jgi:hypothetical protein